MSLNRPQFLWLFFLLLPMLGFELLRILRLGPSVAALWGVEASRAWRARRFLALTLRSLALCVIVFALSGPVAGMRAYRQWTTGLDVVFALDVSRSMNVVEEGSTRLERAVRQIRVFMDQLEGSRFSLVVFKGRSLTLFPLSDDREAIDEFLESAGSHLLSDKGTNIDLALLEAGSAALSLRSSARSLILLSDGEGLSGNVAQALAQVQDAALSVYAVGFGREAGAEVPGLSQVISRRDRKLLKSICQSTGGLYADEESSSGLASIVAALRLSLGSSGQRSLALRRIDGSPPFIAAAALLLFFSVIVMRWGGALQAGTPGRAGKALALSLCLAFLFSSCERSAAVLGGADAIFLASRGENSRAADKFLKILPRVGAEDSHTILYDTALCYAALGESGPALDLAQRAADSTDKRVSANAHYAIGSIHFAQSRYREAYEAFKACLRLDPSARDAQINLELAWERIEKDGGAQSTRNAEAERGQGARGEAEEFDIIRNAERDRYKNSEEGRQEIDRDDY